MCSLCSLWDAKWRSWDNVNTRKQMSVGLAVLAVIIVSVAGAFHIFRTKTWTFKDVSTASKPYDQPSFNGGPCADCKVIGPTIVVMKNEYVIGKEITRPDGWSAEISWSVLRKPNEFLPIPLEPNERQELPWHLNGATFLYNGEPGGRVRNADEWQRVIDDVRKANGRYTGRVTTGGSSEFVYWGRVSITQDSKFHCATDCLVLFRWGDPAKGLVNYTIHLIGKMRPEIWAYAIP